MGTSTLCFLTCDGCVCSNGVSVCCVLLWCLCDTRRVTVFFFGSSSLVLLYVHFFGTPILRVLLGSCLFFWLFVFSGLVHLVSCWHTRRLLPFDASFFCPLWVSLAQRRTAWRSPVLLRCSRPDRRSGVSSHLTKLNVASACLPARRPSTTTACRRCLPARLWSVCLPARPSSTTTRRSGHLLVGHRPIYLPDSLRQRYQRASTACPFRPSLPVWPLSHSFLTACSH